MRIFQEMVPDVEHQLLVREAICNDQVSKIFEGILASASSVGYKTAVLRDLPADLQYMGSSPMLIKKS